MQPEFAQTYADLPSSLSSACKPTPVKAASMFASNSGLAKNLGLDLAWFESAEAAQFFAGSSATEFYQSRATAYAGFQFGQYNPQLGDGRALLLGERQDAAGQTWEIQLKGAGPTPFSRGGDGRSALGPVIREYLISEWMNAQNVSTTRALGALTTGEPVIRERILPGGILIRVAPSHIRFGSFQYAAARQDAEALTALVDLSFARHYPNHPLQQRTPLALLELVIDRTAELVARWLSLGFIHGVMNTDNMSVGGLTIDYGPCAFQDDFHWERVFSSIDTRGRYRFGNQPPIALWNLARFAESLLPLLDDNESAAIGLAEQALANFESQFNAYRETLFAQKVGMLGTADTYQEITVPLLGLMQDSGADFTLSFAYVEALTRDHNERLTLLERLIPQHLELKRFWQSHLAQAATYATSVEVNPLRIPRNHQIEQAIKAAESGDFKPFKTLEQALLADTHEHSEETLRGPKPQEWLNRTFCGT